MSFGSIPPGTAVFVDANILVYHLTAHAILGSACTGLVQRIEQNTLSGLTATHVLSEVTHRLMLIEASQMFGWPLAGALKRLKKNPQEISKLVKFRLALQEIHNSGMQVLTIDSPLIDAAAALSQQTGLLSNDALIVAVMQHHRLNHLASHDYAFDRVPGLMRYGPD